MMTSTLDDLRLELSIRNKNGLNFILAASIVWLAIAYIWTLDKTAFSRSILTFYVGAVQLPLAFALSKLIKIAWSLPDNPLSPLGLWLNFAQLFYFPILFFALSRHPEYFVMVYAIITGAHFFPYGWFYNTRAFVIMAGVVSVGCMLLQLRVVARQTYIIPLFVSGCLLVLAVWLYVDYRQKQKKLMAAPSLTY